MLLEPLGYRIKPYNSKNKSIIILFNKLGKYNTNNVRFELLKIHDLYFLDKDNFLLIKLINLFNSSKIYVVDTNIQADYQFIASDGYCRMIGYKAFSILANSSRSYADDTKVVKNNRANMRAADEASASSSNKIL
ncbi:hypothetical protein H8356DRAFT_920868 [Neocallimastix lanati (nom. inval.)]|uniref:Uncharacterized protein n=1 Tax=Neocallimastix californiae TaxID=1754190 RepID=A0A1Y2F4I0_9FUNG|nr:hypothetical protein H8356DRAFT_920868 [Neocallimastix sp. JGI-2020a]ORY78779.1 hypothetical protein LY90DRAFT_500968 [Neocallimastix californiae]|eukprot:ORY78779.1 hypothetical protein LY90DRAFT_500968 [Neocallimastix californiae]